MRAFRHLAVVILLGLFVGTPGASAAEPRPGARQAHGIAWSTPNPIDSLRNLLVSLWSTMGLGAGNKEGCDIDPLGRCITAPNKEGCAIDPAGRCITAPNKEGCAIDPLGRCIVSPEPLVVPY
jgi:hypothetical protein